MDELQQEIEAAGAAIARAAALVKGGVVGTVAMCAALETLDDAVGDLQFEIERQLAPPGTSMARSTGRTCKADPERVRALARNCARVRRRRQLPRQ